MGRRLILVGMIFLLLPWLLVGCGISQELYDAVTAERDSLVAQLQLVQSELDATKSKLQSIRSELEGMDIELKSITGELGTAKSEVESTQSELADKESELQSAQSELEAVKTELEAALVKLVEAEAPVAPPAPAVEGQTYHNAEFGFSCDFPKGWDVEEEVGVTVMFAGPIEGKYDYMVDININAVELPYRAELDELVNLNDVQLRQLFPSFVVTQEYETTVGGVPAIVQVFTIGAEDVNGIPLKDAIATFLKGKTAYAITLDVSEDLYEKYRDEFILVTETFKFE